MNVYTNTSFTGHWPVGTAAVVVAESATQAAFILNLQLKTDGLIPNVEPEDMTLLDLTKENVVILSDGEY